MEHPETETRARIRGPAYAARTQSPQHDPDTHLLVQLGGDPDRPLYEPGMPYAGWDLEFEPFADLVHPELAHERFDWDVVAEEEHSDAEGETRAFVEETDGETTALLVVQAPQPAGLDRLVLDDVQFAGSEAAVDVEYQSLGGPAAVTLATLLVRLQLPAGEPPEAATVTLSEHPWHDYEPVTVEAE